MKGKHSIMVILLNCVTLGMYQPCENIDCTSERCQILQAFDAFIYIFFALEMVVKMVALGIFGHRCYLGDTWNRLDFFIVMAGIVEYSLDLQNINFSAIRTVRVLRPLKAINRVPSMRILVNLLLDTLPMLGNVLLLCFFVFFIFGIIGVQLWAGLLRNRCYPEENFTLTSGITLPTPYYQPEEDDERPFICSLAQDNGIMSCSDVPARREGGRECCLDKEDALHRQTLGLSAEPLVNGSASTVGLCVNWNQYYTRCHTGHTNPHKGAINFDNIGYAWIVIFQVITLEGWVEIMYYVMDAHSFYNFIYFIFLIIIGSFFMINLCLVVIATQFSETKQREHQLMQEQRARYLSSSTLASLAEPGDCYEELFQLVCHILRKARRRSAALYYMLRGKAPPPGGGRWRGKGGAGSTGGGANVNGSERHHCHSTQIPHCIHDTKLDQSSQSLENAISLSVTPKTEECLQCAAAPSLKEGLRLMGHSANGEEEEVALEENDRDENRLDEKGDNDSEDMPKRKRTCLGKCKDIWDKMSARLWGIVESKYFNRGIMIAILINTISMGIEHHNQAIVVCEIIGQSDGGLSVLRTFRLLRVIKLVRFMPALRRQLVVLMKTMDNVATFCMLLMLFIFIFSILGMHIFGCKFSLKTEAGDTVPDRKNFDSLLWAIVTVFQILTQEDWNMVLYNGMASTSPLAALYFVALMTFGNYVLFNLLVAILVEGFQAEGDANRSCSDDDRSSCNLEETEKKDSLQLSDPKISTLTPNGHLDLAPAPNARGLYPSERLSFALSSRKSSMSSLSRASLEQTTLCPGRASMYHNWGQPARPGIWSRRSSWNSLSRSSRCLGMGGGGSLRVCSPHSRPVEQESLLSPPPPPLHPPLLSRHFIPRRERRALSLELPELLQVPGPALPPLEARQCKKSFSGGLGSVGEHQDCNGKTPSVQPQIINEVYPQVNARKDREDLDDELDYSLCFRMQKMIEVYRPDWCETREDWSVFLFSPQNKFRMLCQSIIAHKLFDYVVLAFIFSNCITVALERPKILQGSLERLFLTVSNYIFTAIFVGEMTLKVVSMGLYIGEQAYLRSSWNVLDGFLVFVSLIDIVVSMAGGAKILGVLRVLRLLRTLRPLRVISRAPGLKLVVETLITSLKPIGNIVLICCAFFIIFGILGVQLFKGKFYYCLGLDVKNITNKSDCLLANYKWVHHKYNFDNLGQALMSLFVLASKDGWVNIMYHGLDAVAVDQQPITNNNPWMLLYFISFLLIVSFFVLNMFVGVVVENFHKCRQHQEVEEAKRREEKRLRRMEKKRRKAQKLPYYASYSHVRLMIHTLCTSHYLDIFITFIICVNVVTMSLEHYSQPRSLEITLKYCNYFFTSTFVLEAVLKLIAFGFRRFFKDRWNQLDLAIVLLSVMGIILEEIEISASLPINPTIIRIMRVLRIARVLKLLKMATGMRALLDTVVQALPQVGNLGLLFMLLFFIYAALGVELFGELVCNEDYPCEGMSRHATFENFGMAFLTLFQVSTGDNWNGIMKDTLRECPPGEYTCNPSLQFISPMYFVSFVLTAQFVLINVVVAVLMKHLDDSNKEAQEEAEMDAEIELELAQGTLCCIGGGGSGAERSSGGHQGAGPCSTLPPHSPNTHPGAHEPNSTRKLYSPAQENLWLDSVSLLIKDSFEGEMLMIDNLSGSVFHHYSSPPICKDCRTHPQEQIHMAELEQASLRSEQLSDKSSSPALPDDLSLDEQSVYQMSAKEGKERGCDECLNTEEPGGRGHSRLRRPSRVHSSGTEEGVAVNGASSQSPHHNTPARHSIGGVPSSNQEYPGVSGASSRSTTPIHLIAEFFHPAAAALPAPPRGRPGHKPRGLRLTSPASWASLRSPGANTRLLTTQYSSHSDSSLATGSSESSLPTTMEEGLSFTTQPLLDTLLDDRSSLSTKTLRPSPPAAQNLQTMRGHQRSKSSCERDINAGRTRQDSDEDVGMVRCGSNQTCDSQQLSETPSSLSLTSLLLPSSLAPPFVKKCNSTGSLDQGILTTQENVFIKEPQGKITSPWKERKEGRRESQSEAAQGKDGESTSQITIVGSRRNR
ncbi:voltage-dependent T-type calcium channel subunit alpha-1I-like [Sinocyclocheilus grahami]|uniref:voltage-dependent T-type calcium channel subunit alpha-1I-like n=1 Tax=Sinocyclocheilus grahami TaxID=75366 RepID=UPI0007AD0D0F|nr:PREDICTED: voltage-dependent T-type calcium channel subunit alpha-1I-like [Sinocyclocheilus grahami]